MICFSLKPNFVAAIFAVALAIYMIVSALSFDFDSFGVAYIKYAIGRDNNLKCFLIAFWLYTEIYKCVSREIYKYVSKEIFIYVFLKLCVLRVHISKERCQKKSVFFRTLS